MNGSLHAPLVQAALVHAQFETIHPFTDGNGRVGRALIHTVLARRGLAPRQARLDNPSGGSQATVPMSAGTEISRSSRSFDAAVSLCRRPPGM